ncbi:helix-turn-helix domain-containing protein [Chryseobacterium caseinilyticum]|uniref:Helix-turn-helix transcriptional regulator n=1 Tax=Chryseobacterium caseinilyticum TaxID=2771428 RepID=A0ABR8Z713_9FLAO|nr:helix-turn-helix transcriptional regulator [Chryseobacterium caseinilyticum]MBD8081092.1 helix-turn-helix transcriptional regulator [Chryseobacterium caseinilyticum]
MTISEKIYHYLKIKDMQVKDFAEKLAISRVTISAMLNGRNRFSQDFFEALHEKFPDIDINLLLDKNTETRFLKTDQSEESSSERIQTLENGLRDMKKIFNKMKI